MGILTKHQIIDHLRKGELLLNANVKEDGDYDVEPASYDLRAGTFIWKEYNPQTKENQTCVKQYDPNSPVMEQIYSIQPGQVFFVITYEEVMMPDYSDWMQFPGDPIPLLFQLSPEFV